ncbi:MAG: TetR/AcrR family transcriptional regulator [Roseburia sp.]|nr:TetR/AcrR family transcriptional regulator [Roseburia sp.]
MQGKTLTCAPPKVLQTQGKTLTCVQPKAIRTQGKALTCVPPKVLQMYRAVKDMIEEGWDVNTMKVSDITARAGIGKGTAYEYFSSKEEIITNALAHDVSEMGASLEQLAAAEKGFEKKVRSVLDFVEKNFGETRMFCTLVRIGTGSYEITESLQKEFMNLRENVNFKRLEELMDRIMEQGVREGIIKETNAYFRRKAFEAQIISFGTFMAAESSGSRMPVSAEEMKDFVYRSLVGSLSGMA